MDEMDLIETPENVELERQLTGIGSRLVAGFVDHMLIAGVYLVLIIVLMIAYSANFNAAFSFFRRASMWAVAFLLLVLFAVYWGYFVFFELRSNGRSPGKKSAKIRVVKAGGGPITFTDVAIRNLLRIVDGIMLYAVGGVCMFVTRKGQRLGDLAAGTVVISEAEPDYSARSDRRGATQWEQEVSAEALRATGLTPEEYRVLHNYWARRHQLTMEARERLLPKLLRPVLDRTGEVLSDESITTVERYVDQLMTNAAAADREKPTVGPPLRRGPQ